MYYESTAKKVWRVIYPILTHLAIYGLALFLGGLILSSTSLAATADEALTKYSAYITSAALIIAIPILYMFFRKDYVPKSNFIFKNPKYLVSVIVMALLASHGLSLLISIVNINGIIDSYSEVEAVIFSSDLFMLILRTIILAPLCEELLFRGLVFRRLRDYKNSFWIAAVVSSLIFGIYHWNVPQGIFAFIFGIILCYVYDKFKNLWVPMIVHAAGNALSLVLTLTGANYPSIAVYIIAMVLALGLAFVVFYFVVNKAEVTGVK